MLIIGLLMTLAVLFDYLFISQDVKTLLHLKKLQKRTGIIISTFMTIFYLAEAPETLEVYDLGVFDWFWLAILVLIIVFGLGYIISLYLLKYIHPKFFDLKDNDSIKQINTKINEIIVDLISKINKKK